MDIVKNIIKYITYPTELRLLGRRELLLSYRELQEKQYRSLEENCAEQRKLLYDILQYAIKNVPYYKELANREKIKISLDTVEKDLKKFPVLTKEIIRNEGSRLFSNNNIPYVMSTSGGSTGEPVQLRHDKTISLFNTDKYFLSFAGYDIGDKIMLLWGSEKDIFRGTLGIKAEISNRFIQRVRWLNSFKMDEDKMYEYVGCINKWKPKVIRAYIQSAYELAVFIKKNKLVVHSPSGIVVSAGTLFPDWKQLIEEVFKCPVINQYGSREVSGIAISCPGSSHLHCNMFMNYVEIVDENGRETIRGEDGRVIITNLQNRSMPLIRYEIGDIASVPEEDSCGCGRNTPMLGHVKGRTVNVFRTRTGTRVDGEYFTHLFYGKEWVNRFQVIQKDYEKIEVYIELQKGKEPISSEINELKEKIRLVMGEGCKVKIQYKEKILPSSSGKNLYTISELKD